MLLLFHQMIRIFEAEPKRKTHQNFFQISFFIFCLCNSIASLFQFFPNCINPICHVVESTLCFFQLGHLRMSVQQTPQMKLFSEQCYLNIFSNSIKEQSNTCQNSKNGKNFFFPLSQMSPLKTQLPHHPPEGVETLAPSEQANQNGSDDVLRPSQSLTEQMRLRELHETIYFVNRFTSVSSVKSKI